MWSVCHFFFNGISTLMGHLILNSSGTIQPTAWGGARVGNFLKGSSPKMILTVQLEFELIYFEAAVKDLSHNTIGIPP